MNRVKQCMYIKEGKKSNWKVKKKVCEEKIQERENR